MFTTHLDWFSHISTDKRDRLTDRLTDHTAYEKTKDQVVSYDLHSDAA